MKLDTVGARVIWARTQKGWDAANLTRESGVPQGTVSKIERGEQKSTGKHGSSIAKSTGVRLEWLSTGMGDPYLPMIAGAAPIKTEDKIGDYDVSVRQFRDIRMAAGGGIINGEPEELDALTFKLSYMKKEGLNPDRCISCPASGDSMSPSINDGDAILINLDEKDLTAKEGKIFAFAIGQECRIKRVYRTATGGIRLVSDNPNKVEFPDEIVSTDELDQLHVAGRVRWSGGNH